MIEFQDHSDENRQSFLAVLDGRKSARTAIDWPGWAAAILTVAYYAWSYVEKYIRLFL